MKPKTAGREGGTIRPAIPIEQFESTNHHYPDTDLTGVTLGSAVMTLRGLRRVETLSPGDRIVTRSAGALPIERIKRCSFVTRAVYIIAGSMGHHQRDRDTLLPAAQCVLLRDWRAKALTGQETALVPARALVDGEFVRDLGYMPVSVIRLFCAAPHVIYADGMELGTADAAPSPLLADA